MADGLGKHSKIYKLILYGGVEFLIDREDAERVHEHKWVKNYNKKSKSIYAYTFIDGKRIKLHRFLMNAPIGFEVDHINHDAKDNRKSNLRVCTRLENARNREKYRTNKFGFKGVQQDKRIKIERYQSSITVDNKTIYLGSFSNVIDAAKAYDIAAKKYFCQFASLNFK